MTANANTSDEFEEYKSAIKMINSLTIDDAPVPLPPLFKEEVAILTTGGVTPDDWRAACHSWKNTENPVALRAPYSYVRAAAIGNAATRLKAMGEAQRRTEDEDG